MNNEIKGISCVVKNCVHHDSSDCCTADHIEVGNQSAKKRRKQTAAHLSVAVTAIADNK